MTDTEHRELVDDRFRQWRHRMVETGAVPLFMVGVTEAGQAVTCIPQGVSLRQIEGLTAQFLDLIRAAVARDAE